MHAVLDQRFLHMAGGIGTTEDAEEILAVVVIAEHHMRPDRKLLQAVLQQPVCGHLAPFAQSTGHDAAIGVGMMGFDVTERRIEPREGVETPKQFARGHQMKVSKMDKFHADSAVSVAGMG